MTDLAYIVLITAVSVSVIGYGLMGLRRLRNQPMTREAQLSEQVRKLRATLDVVMEDRVRDQQRITKLETQLAEARRRITELEYTLSTLCSNNQLTTASKRRLLVGIGPDARLEVDLTMLRKVKTQTGLEFERLLPVTKKNFKDKLSRARIAGEPFVYAHLATHMGPDGAVFADERGGQEIVTALELSEILQDVEVLFLAGCESTTLGNYLGVVPAVVAMQEEIEHNDAADFTLVFWREIGLGAKPEDAFNTACDRVPAVAEFAEFHH